MVEKGETFGDESMGMGMSGRFSTNQPAAFDFLTELWCEMRL
jgi:hypothetical protein